MAIILTETENYPLSACISDTGGAAGLFLGLHVIGKLFFWEIFRKPQNSGILASISRWLDHSIKAVSSYMQSEEDMLEDYKCIEVESEMAPCWILASKT